MNAQMQDLQLFPPISSTNPMPLYTWLQSLSRPDRRRCLYLALLPIYLGYHIFDTHMLPHLTHGIATCFEFYQNTGGMLPSSTHKQMAEYKRQKLHNTSGYDLPLRAMLSHAAHSMSIVSNIWRMSLTRKFWLHPWLSLSLPAEHALRPRGPVGFEDIKGSSIAEVRLWPNDFYRRAFIGLAQDFVLFPVAGLASRLAANWLLRDPAISRLPQAPSVQARLRPLLPGQGLFSIDGLRSFGSLMGQVAMTFLLQTAVKTVLVCVESMVALGVSRYRLAGKKRIFALGAAQHEQEDRQ